MCVLPYLHLYCDLSSHSSCRNEPAAAAAGSRVFMWGHHPTEPSVVPQDGPGSEPHAAAGSGPATDPTAGSEPRGTSQLPSHQWPQWLASTGQHLLQQQVKQAVIIGVCVEMRTCSLTGLPGLSVYPQQSQYSTQPNGGMYHSNNTINLGVMSSSGSNMNQLPGQMTPMSTEQVGNAHLSVFPAMYCNHGFLDIFLWFFLTQVSNSSLILEQLAGIDMLTQDGDASSVSTR